MQQMLFTVLIYGGVIAAFYFFFIRPQKQQKKEIESMRSSLSKGDVVVTIGGIIAEILNIEGDNLVIKSKGTENKLYVKRWSIKQKVQK